MSRSSLLVPALVFVVAVTSTPLPEPATSPTGEGPHPPALPVESDDDPAPVVDGVEMFFSELHDPFGASLPGSLLVDIWDQINRLLPTEPDSRGVGSVGEHGDLPGWRGAAVRPHHPTGCRPIRTVDLSAD